MPDIEKKLASLTPEKRALLMQQLKNKGTDNTPHQQPFHIPRAGNPGRAALSHAQQRLWFLDQLEPGSPLYNLHLSLRLEGKLSIETLERSINKIISRHEALRTIFQPHDEEAFQVVLPEYRQNLTIRDLSRIPEKEHENAVRQMIVNEAGKPFDLAAAPPLRTFLIKLTENDHVFFMIIHHIIIDGWSLDVFKRELSEIYNACRENRKTELDSLPIQYIDFAEWQRKRFLDGRLEKQIEYWRKKLENAPPLIELPTDKPRPARKSINGARHAMLLPEDLTQGIRALCQREGVTLFMVLLAAYQILLSRYSGQKDIVVGSPIAGRTQSETEGLIGFFVNSLVLRSDLSANPTFHEFLKQVQQTALEAYDHQDVPFEKLVEKLRPERNLSYSPIYQVAFAFQNMHTSALELDGLKVSTLDVDRGTATFDLSLFVLSAGQGLKIMLEYNIGLFERPTIERMLGHYCQLLRGIIENPALPVCEIPILTPDEEGLILKKWNDTYREYPQEKPLVRLIEQQAETTPGACAVKNRDKSLTYEELNASANQVAHYLIAQGAGPETVIGLCMDRSTEMFIGILGILKAGAAYLPLDPDYPHDRLRFKISDCKVSTIITKEKYRRLVTDFHARPICIDSEWEAISEFPERNPATDIRPDSLCYIIYTSGSTGRPKGVLVEHGNITHSTLARLKYYSAPVEKFILLSSFAFDSSIAGIFWTLCQGGALFLPRQGDEKDLFKIASLIEEERPSHMLCLPSAYNVLLETASARQLSSLNTVIVAGEACPPALAGKHTEKAPQAALYNEYGPTEGTVWSTAYRITPDDATRTQVPIGRPIPNVRTYILDENMLPIPAGIKGELYISGNGLTRGYLNNDVHNRMKFITVTLAGGIKERLYKTGDLARFLPDGNIVFMGRTDSQVKIRGYRIELGEIETNITSHPEVSDAAVVMRDDCGPGGQQLVAYIVPRRGHNPTPGSIRDFICEKLPSYMVPAYYVFLERFKLTPNGKVDKQALPSPETTDPQRQRDYSPPGTGTEKILAEIWADSLGLKNIGINENFFELGGHSLLGVHLLNKVEKATGKRLPIAALFKSPTIAGMSLLLEAHNEAPAQGRYVSPWNSLVAVKPQGSRPPFFCIHGRAHSLARHMHEDQPFYWLHHGQDARRTTYHTVGEIAADHLMEIRNVQPHGPYYLGGFSFGGMVAFEVARQLIQEGEEIALLALFDPTLQEKYSATRRPANNNPVEYIRRLNKEKDTALRLARISTTLLSKGRRLRKTCSDNCKAALCKACMALGKPVPSFVAVFNLIELFKKAAANYEYRPLPGTVTMFVPEIYLKRERLISTLQTRWGNIAQHGVEFRYVKGATTHHKMVEEPHVRNLVEQLEECLSSSLNERPGGK